MKLNNCITANILSDKAMKKIGFRDHLKDKWYYCKCIYFSENKFSISFNISISKNDNKITIDILDEDFLQPYDYQKLLEEHKNFRPAMAVRNFVEREILRLQEFGVIQGYKKGDYIYK